MIDWLTNPQTWIALVTLTSLEIVLGVDNVIFVSILAGKLPPAQQPRARRLGLFLAMFMRIALLFSLTWLIRLTAPLFGVFGHEFSGRDLILHRRRPVPDRARRPTRSTTSSRATRATSRRAWPPRSRRSSSR